MLFEKAAEVVVVVEAGGNVIRRGHTDKGLELPEKPHIGRTGFLCHCGNSFPLRDKHTTIRCLIAEKSG